MAKPNTTEPMRVIEETVRLESRIRLSALQYRHADVSGPPGPSCPDGYL